MKRIIIILMMCMMSAVAFAQSYIVVAGDDVCLRYAPSESTKMNGRSAPRFYTGDTLPYYGQEGNYYMVKWNNAIYYFPIQYARHRGANGEAYTSANYESVVIAGDDVCLRLSPDESSKLSYRGSTRLYTGEVYPYYGTVGNYYKIKVAGGIYYIPKKYGRLR